MTLDEVKRMYEAAVNKRRELTGPYAPQIRLPISFTFAEEGTIMSLSETFSLMFWRLYPNGDVASGLDFVLPNVAFPGDYWYIRNHEKPHRHNYLEISYVYRGSLCQNINGVDYTFHEGDVWIMDRNCLHGERMQGHDAFVLFVEIYGGFFDEMFREAFRNNPAGAFIKEALAEKRDENRFIHFAAEQPSPEVERIFNYILEERERGLPGSNYVIKGLLISLFAILAANYRFSVNEKERQSLDDHIYHEVLSHLREHCHDISLDTLAKTFYFSRNSMSRLIQSHSGMSYKELLQNVRLERAAKLLTETRQTVSEVANTVGYRNISYFYQLFQERYEMTPNDYRGRFSAQQE